MLAIRSLIIVFKEFINSDLKILGYAGKPAAFFALLRQRGDGMLKTHWLWGCLMAFMAGVCCADPVTITPLPPAGGFTAPVEVGKSATIVYTFTNNLPAAKSLSLGIISNPQTNEFAITANTCSGAKVPGRGSCSLSITFTPATPGNKSVQITLQDGASHYTYQPISAVAIPGYTPPPPTVTISGQAVDPLLPESMDLDADPKPFKFEFKNTGNGDATGVSVTSTNPDFSTDCVTSDNTTLKAGSSCTAVGGFSPTTVNQGIVSATFNFNQGAAVTVTASTKVNEPDLSGGLEGMLVGGGLPDSTVINTEHSLEFEFKNTMKNPVNISQRNKFDKFKVLTNDCPDNNQPLPAGKTCTIKGVFSSAEPGGFSEEAVLVPQTGPAVEKSVSTSTIVYSEGGQRQLTLVNKCGFDVWFSMSGNEVPNSTCKSEEDCNKNFPGSSCNIASGTCFWSNYGPNVKEKGFKLNKSVGARSDSATLTVQDPPGNADAIWDGAISASTGCQGSSCKTAACNNEGGTTACAPGVSFQGPATVVNMKFMRNTEDTYSIQVINGFHIPIQIKPNGRIANTYKCGISGSPKAEGAPNTMGACLWKNAVVPQTGQYYWVSGNTPCTNNACSDNKLCGLNSNMDQVCGDFLGYWTPHKACSSGDKDTLAKADKYFHCNTSIAITPENKTTVEYRQLYSCASDQSLLGSCYEDATANDTCCGCVNWQKLAAPDNVMVPGTTKLCKNPNPEPEADSSKKTAWGQVSLPTLRWMKKACPSYAVYPFDTESTTYHCANNTSGLNTVDYTITFCEGDKSGGLPTGKVDGRAIP